MNLDKKNMRKLALLIAFAVLLLVGLQNFNHVSMIFGKIFGLVMPFLLGGCIAFILNVPMSFIERTVFHKVHIKSKRPICMVLSLLFVVGIIAVAVVLVVPQVGRSIHSIGAAFPGFYQDMQGWIAGIANKMPAFADVLADMQVNWGQIDWQKFGQAALTFLSGTGDLLGSTLGVATSVVSGFVNFVLAMFFALYVLMQKEKLGRQVKKLLYAVLPTHMADHFLAVCTLAQQTFANFITGQCTEACILGLMFFVSMSVLQFPYVLLISLLIAVTALIPVFGSFIGCLFGAFFILIENPMQAVWFILLFLAIQQIEGNFIYPHVVGNSVGLPSIWVLVAVSVGGASMGILGMVIFIPVFSVLYALLRGFTNRRLALRAIPPQKWGDPPQPSEQENGK